jgi:glucosylceramidase
MMNRIGSLAVTLIGGSVLTLNSCGVKSTVDTLPLRSSEIIVTSAAGAKQDSMQNVSFRPGTPPGVVVSVYPAKTKQTIDGIGTSFTESSAFVLAHLDPEKRLEVMRNIYSDKGANFTLTRTHIGSCDFSVEGRYSYADKADDIKLESFSIAEDSNGFDPKIYPGVKDPAYDLLPMIQEALSIKRGQADPALRIIGSAWTAPPWMKDVEDYYVGMTAENNWQGTGGSLKPEYVGTYASYLLRYLEAYRAAGVNLWGLTPVNEPHGNNGQWESMNFTPETQSEFVQKHLGPGLRAGGFADMKLLIFDQNRDGMEHWADVLFPADKANKFIYGIAVHWYESTVKVYEDVFDRVHEKYPDYAIVHTEGCIDDLGKPAPAECTDPEGRTESGWFNNDAWWWGPNASDWAYAVTWAPDWEENHPLYTPVHRYARNIIKSIDHWATGWVDWNIVLDAQGGPNHVGNFCGAPIMIDTETEFVYYTPIFDVLAQFSRTIRPGDKAVQTYQNAKALGPDDLHSCATINADNMLSVQLLNTSTQAIEYNLQVGTEYAAINIPANSVQTVRIQLP